MKIQGRKSYPVGAQGPPSVPGQAPVDRTGETEAVTGDTVEISSAGREVGSLRQALGAVPDVRTDRIEGIRDQVEEGSYHVESEVLAKRVVDEAIEDAIRRRRADQE